MSYLLIICNLSRFIAARENRVILAILSVLKICFSVIVPESDDTAIHTIPTGLSALPPEGPAMPVVAKPRSVLKSFLAPSAIPAATLLLTAPSEARIAGSMPRMPVLTLLLYATRDPAKYSELPATLVILCARKPPVQLSARESVSFFIFNKDGVPAFRINKKN